MNEQRSFRLFGSLGEVEVTFSAVARWDAVAQAEQIPESSDFFCGHTEAWLSDKELNCLVCLFDRENTYNVWNSHPC